MREGGGGREGEKVESRREARKHTYKESVTHIPHSNCNRCCAH